MKIISLHDYMSARRLAEVGQTSGELIPPDAAKEESLRALVVRAGSGEILETGKSILPAAGAGTGVLVGEYAGLQAKSDGRAHVVFSEDDVLRIFGE